MAMKEIRYSVCDVCSAADDPRSPDQQKKITRRKIAVNQRVVNIDTCDGCWETTPVPLLMKRGETAAVPMAGRKRSENDAIPSAAESRGIRKGSRRLRTAEKVTA